MNYPKLFISYVFSFCLCSLLLIYALRLPCYISQNKELVEEYYYKNAFTFLSLDFVLIAIYFLIAAFFIWICHVESNALQLITVALVTLIISGAFCLYFVYTPQSRNFFSRWFHAVSWKAVLYDIFFLMIVFTVMMQFYQSLENQFM